MTSRWLALAALAGCGSSPPAVEVAPVPSTPAPAAVPPVDAPAASIEEVADPSQAPGLAPPAIAAECSGAVVSLSARPACVVPGDAQPIPAAIAVTVEPAPLRLGSGAELGASIVLTNTSRDEIVLKLDCGAFWEPTYEMHDRRGRRLDIEGDCGPGGGGCGGPTYGFALPPEGQGRLDFALVARKYEACGGGRGGAAMPKGSYTLRVDSGLGSVSTKIKIY